MGNINKGKRGEALAAQHIETQGYEIIERNYRNGRYEIDIVAQDGDVLVFVEVKARTSALNAQFGTGREAVDKRKQAHMVNAALGYMQQRACADSFIRFDVAEVDLQSEGVTLIRDAFRL